MKLLLLIDENLTRAKAIKKNFDNFEKRHNPLGVFEEIHIVDAPFKFTGTREIGKGACLYSTRRFFGFGYIGIIFKLIRIIKKERIDIIKINYTNFLGLLGVILQKIFNIPCVAGCYNDHRMWQKLFPFDRVYLILILERFVYRQARYVLFQSTYIKKYLRSLGVKEERLKSYYSINTEIENFYNCQHRPDARYFTIVFCGRLHNQKDVWTLLKAFKILRQKKEDSRLWLLGDGPLRKKLERFVKKNNISGVKFFGFIENKEVKRKFELSDLFVLPTLFEGLPNVLWEAKVAGMPIVTTAIPHVADIVSSNDAYLFPPGDYLELARILLKLYRNQPELLRLREATLKRSEEFFAKKPFEKNAQTYRDVYKETKGLTTNQVNV